MKMKPDHVRDERAMGLWQRLSILSVVTAAVVFLPIQLL